MGIRYDGRGKKTNTEETHKELLQKRGLKSVEQYTTPEFATISVPQRHSLINELHIWKMGDSYAKLASKYYGDTSLWWVIGWYNQKPTDAHVMIGDSLAIPLPLDKVLSLFYG